MRKEDVKVSHSIACVYEYFEIGSNFLVSQFAGLVDTAVKTAETGYMARRLMKVRWRVVHVVTTSEC